MLKALALLIASLGCASCSSSGHLSKLSLDSNSTAYRLGGGDQLKITVYGEEKLTGTYPVNGQGVISFPLIGQIPVEGKTIDELEGLLKIALGDGFVNNPSVSVEVANFRPYYILGEVTKPGEYSFADGLTVYSAVARAGGFTYRA